MKIDIDFSRQELTWIKNALGWYKEHCPPPSLEEVKGVYEKYKGWYWLEIDTGDEDYYAQDE